jgi:phenylacetate-CoA ligase
MDRERQAADQAARIRSRRWFGIEPGERELYLWGSPIETGAADALRSMRDRMINHRLISAFRMTPARMADYLREIRSFDPVHLFGYPSSLATLARFALSQSARPPTPALRAVFTTGEPLDPADRALLAASFRVPVADGYGAREAGFIAHECPHGRMHIAAECVLVELLDDAGRAVPVGESGEVVVTNLDNLGMPLIRYRTGDTAWLDARPCPCGRTLPVLGGIEGRQTDRLVRADGGSAHALSAIYVLRDEAGVTRFHVRQRSDLSLDVRIVPAPGWNDDTSNRVSDRLSRQLGGVPVRLSLVESIEPSGSGKFRCVESEAIA